MKKVGRYGSFPCTSLTLGVPTQVHRMILGIVDVAYQGSDCGNQSSTDDVVIVHMIVIVFVPNVCMRMERDKPYVEAQSQLPITVTSEQGEC